MSGVTCTGAREGGVCSDRMVSNICRQAPGRRHLAGDTQHREVPCEHIEVALTNQSCLQPADNAMVGLGTLRTLSIRSPRAAARHPIFGGKPMGRLEGRWWKLGRVSRPSGHHASSHARQAEAGARGATADPMSLQGRATWPQKDGMPSSRCPDEVDKGSKTLRCLARQAVPLCDATLPQLRPARCSNSARALPPLLHCNCPESSDRHRPELIPEELRTAENRFPAPFRSELSEQTLDTSCGPNGASRGMLLQPSPCNCNPIPRLASRNGGRSCSKRSPWRTHQRKPRPCLWCQDYNVAPIAQRSGSRSVEQSSPLNGQRCTIPTECALQFSNGTGLKLISIDVAFGASSTP